MMLKIPLTFFSICSSGLSLFAQITIEGKVLNKLTSLPISYANIGISNKNVGTISNTDGSFSLLIPEKLLNDTITFSSLGYGEKNIAINFFLRKKYNTIHLNEKEHVLPPVIIGSKKQRHKATVLGNSSVRGGILETDTTYAGRSLALLIENKEPYFEKGFSFPAKIESAQLRILRNNLKSFKFRIRLNEFDSLTGKPGKDLLSESIVVQSSIRKGWVVFDLSHLNHKVTKPFFITFEQMTDLQDRIDIANGYREYLHKYLQSETKKNFSHFLHGGIDLPGTFIAISTTASKQQYHSCYTRQTSFGPWEKTAIITATATLSKLHNTSGLTNVVSCATQDILCKAEKLCKDFMDETGMNGMQIAVSRNNKTIWSSNLGYSDWKNRIKVNDSTLFRINSISKSVTSLALLKLISEQRLDLDAPVQKYLPDFPLKKYPVTSRQLAGHLAGFRDYDEENFDDYIRTEHFVTSKQAVKIFKDDTLLFRPGTQFLYSTFGWNLLGAVIEGISGDTYLDYMKKNIWDPLKMTNTSGDDIHKKPSSRSKFYDASGEENDLGDFSYKYAGGGLLSNCTDLLKFGNEILYGNVFSYEKKSLLFESQFTADGQKTNYGIGLYVDKDKNGHRIWYHPGDSFSGSSYLIIYPDDDLVISFLANGQEGVHFDVQKIGQLFYSSF